jgi:hypothetical protein
MNATTWLCTAAALSLALAGCGRGADSGATSNPVSQGRPGTGNDRVVVQPSAPDGPAAGSAGAKGSAPYASPSGGGAVPGSTGTGTSSAQPAPGTGLQGGLGAGSGLTGSFPSGTGTSSMGAAGDGSPNTTTRSSVGNR